MDQTSANSSAIVPNPSGPALKAASQAPATASPKPATGNPNSVEDYALSTGAVKAWNPQSAAALFESQGLGTAKSYTALGANNAAANMALLTKLKGGYSSPTNNASISGSGSVQQNKSVTTAMGAAAGALNTPSTAANSSTGTPPPPVPTPSTPVANPTISSYQSQTSTAIKDAEASANAQLEPLTTAYTANYAALQQQKNKAMSAASAAYDKGSPGSTDSQKQEYLTSIETSYDTQLQNLSDSYNGSALQINTDLQNNKDSITSAYQSSVQTYRDSQTKNLQWTLANDPPEPLDLSGVDSSDSKAIQGALMGWISENQSLIDTAFSTGNYGDENNMQDVLNAAAQLSAPTKAFITEETAESNAAANQSRASSASASVGIAAQNAETNSGRLALDYQTAGGTQTEKPNFLQGLVDSWSGKSVVSTTSKLPVGDSSNANVSNGVDLSQFAQ